MSSVQRVNRRLLKHIAAAGKHFVLLVGAATMVIPLLWMLSTSMKPANEVLMWPPKLIPAHPTLQPFAGVIAAAPFYLYFANSVFIAVVASVSVAATSLLGGFIFAKYSFPLKNVLFAIILATAIFPFETYMLPLFAMVVKLRWMNTYQAMMLPYLIMSLGVFMMRQSIDSAIPDELMDAARIDGCTEWQVLFRIVAPLSTSAVSALGIFAFIETWMAFIWPLIIAGKSQMFTMELGLSMFQRRFSIDYNLLMAGSVMSVTPMIIVFIVLRRRIIEGIGLTGIKA